MLLQCQCTTAPCAPQCAARTAAQWAGVGVTVATPGSGQVCVSSLGALGAAAGWSGAPSITCGASTTVATLAGIGFSGHAEGTGTAARFSEPKGVAIAPDGATAVVAQDPFPGVSYHRIRKITMATGAVMTLAGHQRGFADGAGTSARFNQPVGVAVTTDGISVLVADMANHRIRKITLATGAVTTLAGGSSSGNTNGVGTAARFHSPSGVAVTPDGLHALVADKGNHRIRKVVLSTGAVTTLAGSSAGSVNAAGTSAKFRNPTGVAVTPDGLHAVVADTGNHWIRRVVISTGAVTKLAGKARSNGNSYTTGYSAVDGTGRTVAFDDPTGVAVTTDGVSALVADYGNHQIRQIVLATGAVSTLAGNGNYGSTNGGAAAARFDEPHGLAVAPDGVTVLVADEINYQIRKITLPGFGVTGVTPNVCTCQHGTAAVGGGTSATQCATSGSADCSACNAGYMLSAPAGAGSQSCATASCTCPGGTPTVASGSGGTLCAASGVDCSSCNAGHLLSAAAGAGSQTCSCTQCAARTAAQWAGVGVTVATPGSGQVCASSLGALGAAAGWSGAPSVTCGANTTTVATLAGSSSGSTDGGSTSARFWYPTGVAVTPDGLHALVADELNYRIRKIVISTGVVTTLAGSSSGSTDGVGTSARFKYPTGVAVTTDGVSALVADYNNHRIRKIVLATGAVSTLAGSSSGSANGVGTSAKFQHPTGVAVTTDGVSALVADYDNHRIRKIVLATGAVSTLAGSSSGSTNGVGTSAKFQRPTGVAVTPDGLHALVADRNNHRIRKIVISTGVVTTLAGSSSGSTDGVGTSARFKYPKGVAVTTDGVSALVADTHNHRIRKIVLATGVVSTLAGATSGTYGGFANGGAAAAKFDKPHGLAVAPDGVTVLVADEDNHQIRKITLPGFGVTGVTPNVCTCQHGTAAVGGGTNATQCATSGSADCFACNAGYMLSAPAGAGSQSCAAASCTCPGGTPTVASGSGGTLCAAGGVDCSSCNAGYQLSAAAGAGSQTCIACTAGQYASPGATSCSPCWAGSITDTGHCGGATVCTACGAGRYSVASAAATCIACSAGQYTGVVSQATPTFVVLSRASGVTAVADGSTCASAGLRPITTKAECTAAVAAINSANGASGSGDTGQRHSSSVPAGCYSNSHSSSSGYTSKYFNTYNFASSGGTHPGVDWSGSNEDSVFCYAGATRCVACAPGSITDTLSLTGGTSCTVCPSGQFSAVSSTACASCSAGSVTNTLAAVSATSCTACAAGQYSASYDIACVSCPAGSITDTGAAPGATTCTACGAGRYIVAASAAVCIACPAGQYTGVVSQSTPTFVVLSRASGVTAVADGSTCASAGLRPITSIAQCTATVAAINSANGKSGHSSSTASSQSYSFKPAGCYARCHSNIGYFCAGFNTYDFASNPQTDPGVDWSGSNEDSVFCYAGVTSCTTAPCTPTPAASSSCDAASAPPNGAVGTCTATLPICTTCQPTCNSGYVLSPVSPSTSCAPFSIQGQPSRTVAATCIQATCANGVISGTSCTCSSGYYGGGAWVSGSTYPACIQATCTNGVVSGNICTCDNGYYGGGAWVSGSTYPACIQATCSNGTILGHSCSCDIGYSGGGAWVSGSTYPACTHANLPTCSGSDGVVQNGICMCRRGYVGGGCLASGSNIATCIACTVGQYASPNNVTSCMICPPGSRTDTGVNPGGSSCIACAAGQYSTVSNVASCSPCNAGRYALRGQGTSAACSGACPSGSYAGAGAGTTASCTACPAGSRTDTGVSAGGSSCIACAAGQYSTASNVASCSNCAAGSYTNTLASVGASSCTACAAGQSSTASTIACAPCAAARYQGSTGQSSCIACNAGSRTNTGTGTGASSCTACAAGQYSTASNVAACSLCNAGRYALSGQGTAATCSGACPAASYAAVGAGTTANCIACAAGSRTNTGTGSGADSCRACTAGKYSSASNVSSCSNCAAGSYTNTLAHVGASSCTPCAAGQSSAASTIACAPCAAARYQGSTGQSSCIACNAGSRTNTGTGTGASSCTACAAGQYSTASNVAACSPCSAGRYALSGQGTATTCSGACPSGSYAGAGAGTTASCTVCPAGSRTDTGVSAGGSSCIACAAGRYSNVSNVASCSPCNAGRHAPSGLGISAACSAACPAGLYLGQGNNCTICAAGSRTDTGVNPGGSSCILCAAGRYTIASNVASCSPCNSGRYALTGAGTSAACSGACPAGSYAGAGAGTTAECTACPAGSRTDTGVNPGGSSCIACAAGRYSNVSNVASCSPCNAGRYALSGAGTSAACSGACPAGSYAGAGAGTSPSCTPCLAGSRTDIGPSTGGSSCIACAAGQYSSVSNVASCSPCNAGRYGFSNQTTAECFGACPAGSYAGAGAGTTASCTPCLAGSRTDTGPSTGASSCIACAAGQYSTVSSVASCSPCSAGRYALSGQGTSATCSGACPAGSYAGAGAGTTAACIVCWAGSQTDTGPSTGGSSCIACAAGRYLQSKICSKCNAGSVAEAGVGTGAVTSGATTCTACAVGQYSNHAFQDCAVCPLGSVTDTLNVSGAQSCSACDEGTFSASSTVACDPVDVALRDLMTQVKQGEIVAVEPQIVAFCRALQNSNSTWATHTQLAAGLHEMLMLQAHNSSAMNVSIWLNIAKEITHTTTQLTANATENVFDMLTILVDTAMTQTNVVTFAVTVSNLLIATDNMSRVKTQRLNSGSILNIEQHVNMTRRRVSTAAALLERAAATQPTNVTITVATSSFHLSRYPYRKAGAQSIFSVANNTVILPATVGGDAGIPEDASNMVIVRWPGNRQHVGIGPKYRQYWGQNTTMASDVVTVVLYDATGAKVKVVGLVEPIQIVLARSVPPHTSQNSSTRLALLCTYWNVTQNRWVIDSVGVWRNRSGIHCNTTHLTDFAVFIGPPPKSNELASVEDTLDVVNFARSNWFGLVIALVLCSCLVCDVITSLCHYWKTVAGGLEITPAQTLLSPFAQAMRAIKTDTTTFCQLVQYRLRTSWSCGGILTPLPYDPYSREERVLILIVAVMCGLLASALFFNAGASPFWTVVVSCVIGKPVDIMVKFSFEWLHKPVFAVIHDAPNPRLKDSIGEPGQVPGPEHHADKVDTGADAEDISGAEPLRRQGTDEWLALDKMSITQLLKASTDRGMTDSVVNAALASQDPRVYLVEWLYSFDKKGGQRRPWSRALLPHVLVLVCASLICLSIAMTIRDFSPSMTSQWAGIAIQSLFIRFVIYDPAQIIVLSALATALGKCCGKSSKLSQTVHELAACCSGANRIKFSPAVDIQILRAVAIFQAQLLRDQVRKRQRAAAAALQAQHTQERRSATSKSIAAELRQKQHFQRQLLAARARELDEAATMVLQGKTKQFEVIEGSGHSDDTDAIAMMRNYTKDVKRVQDSLTMRERDAHERLSRRRALQARNTSAVQPGAERVSKRFKHKDKRRHQQMSRKRDEMARKIVAMQLVLDKHSMHVDKIASTASDTSPNDTKKRTDAEVEAAKRRFRAKVKLLMSLSLVERRTSSREPNRPKPEDICYHCRQKGHWKATCPDLQKRNGEASRSEDAPQPELEPEPEPEPEPQPELEPEPHQSAVHIPELYSSGWSSEGPPKTEAEAEALHQRRMAANAGRAKRQPFAWPRLKTLAALAWACDTSAQQLLDLDDSELEQLMHKAQGDGHFIGIRGRAKIKAEAAMMRDLGRRANDEARIALTPTEATKIQSMWPPKILPGALQD